MVGLQGSSTRRTKPLRVRQFFRIQRALIVKRVPFGSTLALVFSLLPIALVAADRPEKFEPYLREHPDDESKREDALVWYARETHDFERLREHTLRMIDHHPSNMHIYFENSTEFLSRPSYHAEVLGRLEARVKAMPSGGGLLGARIDV